MLPEHVLDLEWSDEHIGMDDRLEYYHGNIDIELSVGVPMGLGPALIQPGGVWPYEQTKYEQCGGVKVSEYLALSDFTL